MPHDGNQGQCQDQEGKDDRSLCCMTTTCPPHFQYSCATKHFRHATMVSQIQYPPKPNKTKQKEDPDHAFFQTTGAPRRRTGRRHVPCVADTDEMPVGIES
eukprot:747146-Hanusia_phi.AAC.2